MPEFLKALVPTVVYPPQDVALWLIRAGNAMAVDGHESIAQRLWTRGYALREVANA